MQRENNKDVAFYDSINGQLNSSKTQNGNTLFTYNSLYHLFKNSTAINQSQSAYSGAICDLGEYGDEECKPC